MSSFLQCNKEEAHRASFENFLGGSGTSTAVEVNISITEKRGGMRWRLARKDPEIAEKVLYLGKDGKGN